MTKIEKAIIDRNEEKLVREGKTMKVFLIGFFVVLALTLGLSLYFCGATDGITVFVYFSVIEFGVFAIVLGTFFSSYIPQVIGKRFRNRKFMKLLSENPSLAKKYEEDFIGAERIDVHEDFYPLWLGKENLFVSSLTEMIIIPYDIINDICVKQKNCFSAGPYNLNRRKIQYILVGLEGKRSQKICIGYLESVQSAEDIAQRIRERGE